MQESGGAVGPHRIRVRLFGDRDALRLSSGVRAGDPDRQHAGVVGAETASPVMCEGSWNERRNEP